MRSLLITFFTVTFAALVTARPQGSSTCNPSPPAPACSPAGSQTTYVPEPCFPNTGVCYPTNYYAAQDEGQFSASNGAFDTQLKAKCQAVCDSQSQCASYVGIENITPDGKLATGTCFLYNTQLLTPRQCANPPSRIVAYYKQKVCLTTCSSGVGAQTQPCSDGTRCTNPSKCYITDKNNCQTIFANDPNAIGNSYNDPDSNCVIYDRCC